MFDRMQCKRRSSYLPVVSLVPDGNRYFLRFLYSPIKKGVLFLDDRLATKFCFVTSLASLSNLTSYCKYCCTVQGGVGRGVVIKPLGNELIIEGFRVQSLCEAFGGEDCYE